MNEMIDNTRETVKWIKPVLGKPNFLITNTGAVWSREKNEWLKLYKTGNGHLQVVLDDDSYYPYVHRLVFEAFVRPLEKGQVVHHKNEFKDDNRVENLFVMTRSEHTIHHHLGTHQSQQTKRKMSENRKGRVAWNKGKSNWWLKGKPRSEQTKRKISQTKLGKKRSPYKKSVLDTFVM